MGDGSIDAIDFYWRPGCGFCMMLGRSLKKSGVPMNRLNIWEEPEHAAFVRSVAQGNETVPTVAVGSVSLVNPTADEVLRVVAARAPHLLPEEAEESDEADEPSRMGRFVNKILGG